MKLNRGQILSIIIVVLGVLVASTSQLNELFGPNITKYVVSAATLSMSMMAGVSTILQSQGSQLLAVQDMPGVEKVLVNSQANATLASLAVDPTQGKIEAMPAAQQAVQATARAAA